MSIKEKCAAGVRDAYGREMSDVEIEDFVADIELRAKHIRAKDASLSMTDALEKAATDKGNMIKMAAIAKKRATYIGFRRAFETIDFIDTSFLGREAEGLYSRVVSTEGGEALSRISSGNEQRNLHQAYMGQLNAMLSRETDDIAKAFSKKSPIRGDIAEAIARLSDDAKDFSDLDPTAVKLAKAVHTVGEIARSDHNRAGGFVGKAKGYVASQLFWNPINISKNLEGFRAVMEKWDWEEMGYYTKADIEKAKPYFEQNMKTGVHLGQPNSIPKAKGLQGMARGAAQERVIHFKSAADYLEAMDMFGHGGLMETIHSDLARYAKSTGMMRVFGPDHINTFDTIVDTISRRVQKRGGDVAKFKSEADGIKDNFLREQDGSLDIPANELKAKLWSNARALESLAHLQNTFAATMNDVATMGMMAKWNGLNPVEVIGEGIRGWFEGIPDNAKQDALADLGVYFESQVASFAMDRTSVEPSVSGWIGKAQQVMYQINLQNRMTNGGQNGIAHVLARNLSRTSKLAYDALDKEFKITLGAYGIDSGKWDIVRSVVPVKDYKGIDMITPSQLREVPDAQWKAYLDTKGVKSSKFAIDELREETFGQLRGYLIDQMDYGVLSSSAKTRGIVKGGSRAGTDNGEIRRAVFQFKSFPIEFYHRVIKREIKRGSPMTAAARLMVYTGTVGMISNFLTDLMNGKDPRALTQNPVKTLRDGLLRGGAGGIYADTLNTLMQGKNPQEAAVQLAGPIAGDVFGKDGVVSLINKGARDLTARAQGDTEEANKQDFASTLLKFTQSNTPFINQFMVKHAINYMFMYELQESLNPGTLERMEKRMQEDTGQTFMVPPSETVQ